jgi:hypothetical protein
VLTALAEWATDIQLDGEELRLKLRTAVGAPEILRHLVTSGVEVFEFVQQRSSLEERFLQLAGGDTGL